jgi:hypothetical protein
VHLLSWEEANGLLHVSGQGFDPLNCVHRSTLNICINILREGMDLHRGLMSSPSSTPVRKASSIPRVPSAGRWRCTQPALISGAIKSKLFIPPQPRSHQLLQRFGAHPRFKFRIQSVLDSEWWRVRRAIVTPMEKMLVMTHAWPKWRGPWACGERNDDVLHHEVDGDSIGGSAEPSWRLRNLRRRLAA